MRTALSIESCSNIQKDQSDVCTAASISRRSLDFTKTDEEKFSEDEKEI